LEFFSHFFNLMEKRMSVVQSNSDKGFEFPYFPPSSSGEFKKIKQVRFKKLNLNVEGYYTIGIAISSK
jgi:hypothetical protein